MPEEAIATVSRDFGRITREGRGFSLDELKKAGIDYYQARKFGLPIDGLRKSVRNENVERLAEPAKQIAAKLGEQKNRPKKTRASEPTNKSTVEQQKVKTKQTKRTGLKRLRRTKKAKDD